MRTLLLKSIPLLALFLFASNWADAQKAKAPATLTWGSENDEPNNSFATKTIGISSEGFYVLRQKLTQNMNSKPKFWVEHFSREMKMLRSEQLDLKYKRKVRDFEDVLFLNNKLYLLTSFNNTAKKRNYLFRQELNAKTLLPNKNLDLVAETEARNKEVEGTFAFAISKDSARLLVYNELPYEKKSPERFGFRVFDQDFKLVWEKNIVLPYNDDQFTVEEYRVDEEGNVFLLGVLYEDGAKWRRRGKPTYRYVTLAYLDNGTIFEEYRIDLEDKFITDLTFRITKEGSLTFAGFYSERGTYSIKGTYFFQLDPYERALKNRKTTEFDFKFRTAFMSNKSKERALEATERNDARKEPELFDYSLDDLILRSDGGAVLFAEQYYVEQDYNNNNFGLNSPYYSPYYDPFYYSRYGYGYGRQQPDYYYHYNDIIAINISPDGNVEWASRIPKRQETRNDGGYYSSYAMATTRDGFFFVFNDDARNFGRDDDKLYTYSGRSNSVVALAHINIKGEVSVYPLSAEQDAGVTLRPKMCKQIGKREMAMLGERGRGYRFGSLKFD
ncbi:MAG: hypothetical protein IT258_15385 [Saprospiraceae bacterium]|nr:hypothetical protein [Saprospiraceae bacterium]